MSLKQYEKVISKVYQLSLQEPHETHASALADLDLKKLREQRDNSELLSYLQTLDVETLLAVQTVMYIGANYTKVPPDDKGEQMAEILAEDPEYVFPKESLRVEDPEAMFEEWKNSLHRVDGENTQNIEAEHIYEKYGSLPNYLQRASEILGITL